MDGKAGTFYEAHPGSGAHAVLVDAAPTHDPVHQPKEPRYIVRRLSVRDGTGAWRERTEKEFLENEGPLVILGEPGIGKSRLMQSIREHTGSPKVHRASTLELSERVPEVDLPQRIIIDGVDEVAAHDSLQTIVSVLRPLHHLNEANFVLACRSADWVDKNSQDIGERWGQPPVVGILLPLDEEEIARFVDERGGDHTGEEFLREAQRRGIAPLLGNPQTLLMALGATGTGWPTSRQELHERMCHQLASEHNPRHRQGIGRDRSPPSALADTAGLVFAQLLLAGKEGVAMDGNGRLPTPAKLTAEGHDTAAIRQAMATNLFRVEGDALVPCHRTVAEFLAAKWIAGALAQKTLLPRTLDALLRVRDDMVPSSLRGLHAWIATLHAESRRPFISRDPYGFWCHGDRSRLTAAESEHLLDALARYAEQHPGFYDQRGRLGFGGWPADPSLQERITKLMSDPKTPTLLARLVIESIEGTPVIDEIEETLEDAVLNADSPNRDACLDALISRRGDPYPGDIVEKLLEKRDIESLCVATDAVRRHADRLDGTTIADVLAAAGTQTHYLGLGQGSERQMSEQQLRDGLVTLRTAAGNRDSPHWRGAQEWMPRFLEELFHRGIPPSPDEFWECARVAAHPFHLGSRPSVKIMAYLDKDTAYRRAAQATIIREAKELRQHLFQRELDWPGLAMREPDWLHQLRILTEQKPPGWEQRWRAVFEYGQIYRFSVKSMEEASELAKGHPQLDVPGIAPERTPDLLETEALHKGLRESEKRFEELLDKWQAKFKECREQVSSGEAVKLLYHAAAAYLGYGVTYDIVDTPKRLVARLAGDDMVGPVFAGIDKIVTDGTKVPPPREIAEVHASNQKSIYEDILLAYCHRAQELDTPLTPIRRDVARSALAAYHLNPWTRRHEAHQAAQSRLEKIVWSSPRETETYFRDIIEPLLEKNALRVPGIELLQARPELSDMAGSLACMWIKNHPDLRPGLFWDLVHLPRGECVRKMVTVIRSKIRRGDWASVTEREHFMCAAFELDFGHQRKAIAAFAREDKDRFWGFKDSVRHLREVGPEQIGFVLGTFAPMWSWTDHPGGLQVGGRHAWEATHALYHMIERLKTSPLDEATAVLEGLAKRKDMGDYQREIKDAHISRLRNNTDRTSKPLSLERVRDGLFISAPVSHVHLQDIVMDALAGLQSQLRNSDTDDVDAFWKNGDPHIEEYCRNRIKREIRQMLESRSIETTMEATMPRRRRSDLVCKHRDMEIPIEIKCQWGKNMWTAAHGQIKNYALKHEAGNTAIYLVLWFGETQSVSYRARSSPEGQRARSATELREMLSGHNQSVPYRLMTFVLDLSREKLQRPQARKRRAQ